MRFDTAIKYLRRKYEEGKSLQWVERPLAWALYQTWRYVEKSDQRKAVKANKEGAVDE